MANEILEEYHLLVSQVDEQIAALRASVEERMLCPPTCYICCLTAATLPISEVEGMDLKAGLMDLTEDVRNYIWRKASGIVRTFESLGYSLENIIPDSGNKALDDIKGSEAECPLLIGGICSVYQQRPILCRIWGFLHIPSKRYIPEITSFM